jgi:hypothetical protein
MENELGGLENVIESIGVIGEVIWKLDLQAMRNAILKRRLEALSEKATLFALGNALVAVQECRDWNKATIVIT